MSNFFKALFGSPTSADENEEATAADNDAAASASGEKDPNASAQDDTDNNNNARQVRARERSAAPPALKMQMLPLLRSQSPQQMPQPQQQQQQHSMPVHQIPRRPLRASASSHHSHMLRERSLSKVFNQLPVLLPSLAEIQLDIVEWYCHVCLLETNSLKLQSTVEQLSAALGPHKPRTYGRLFNRLHLVALWNDICCLPFKLSAEVETETDTLSSRHGLELTGQLEPHGGGGGGAGNEQHVHFHDKATASRNKWRDKNDVPDISISADQWQQVREQLVLLKSYLLRQDANLPVPTLQQVPPVVVPSVSVDADVDQVDQATVNAAVTVPSSQATPDGQLEKHDMFQQDYQQVILLLHVHQVLAKFKESLQKIAATSSQQQQQHQQQSKDKHVTSVNKRVEQAIDAYENSLLTVFENHSKMNPKAAALSIPKELTAFLLRDLYQKGSNVKNQPAHNMDLVTSLLCHVRNMCLNAKSEYSHASLKTSTRALLIKWSESILDIPVLVQLGYGGVTNPVVENEGDDVSSWGEEGPPVGEVGGHVGDGDDDQPLMTQVETLDMEDLSSPITAAMTVQTTKASASGSPVTEEDRVILQKLGDIQSSPVAQRTVRKMPRSAALIAKDDAEDNMGSGNGAGNINHAMDMEPLSTQVPEPLQQVIPLMTQPSELTPEDDGYVAGDENLEGREQAEAASTGYIPSMKELLDGTEEIFNEITDPDNICGRDVFKSLSERYGFKLGRAQKRLVVDRLTDLMIAKTALLTNGDNNANTTPPAAATANAVSANESMEENDIDVDNDNGAESNKASANGGEENDEKPAAKKRAAKRSSNEFKSIEWPDSEDSISEADYVSPRRSFKKAKTTRKPSNAYTERVRFTEDEVAALREGIDKFGVGKWQMIINDSNGRLSGRSGVQVKDKYRTMFKSGKIGNPEPKSETRQAEEHDADVAHV